MVTWRRCVRQVLSRGFDQHSDKIEVGVLMVGSCAPEEIVRPQIVPPRNRLIL